MVRSGDVTGGSHRGRRSRSRLWFPCVCSVSSPFSDTRRRRCGPRGPLGRGCLAGIPERCVTSGQPRGGQLESDRPSLVGPGRRTLYLLVAKIRNNCFKVNDKLGLIISKNKKTQLSACVFVYCSTHPCPCLQLFLLPSGKTPSGDEQSSEDSSQRRKGGQGPFSSNIFFLPKQEVFLVSSPGGFSFRSPAVGRLGWPGRCKGNFEVFPALSAFAMEGEFS